jgi:hypothetical protein
MPLPPLFGQTRLRAGIIDVILRIERMCGPAEGPVVRLAVAAVVPPVPDLNLDDDVTLGGQL